jgi:diaminopropionate ammonia-lyase
MPSSLYLNHATSPLPADARPGPEVQVFHRTLPGYEPTPLRDMPTLAKLAGVGRVLVKDESSRLGLPAFKVLGASWATIRLLADRLGADAEWTSLDGLAETVAAELGSLRLAAASDGNHGRAVAHMARLLGVDATIAVPEGTAEARIDGIASEGAEVIVSPGNYEDAVTLTAGMAGATTLIVSDTSWPGYEDVPRRVIEGYSTIFAEIEDQAAGTPIDLAVIPLGVGALGASAGTCLRAGRDPDDAPLLVGVEPTSAACVVAAVRAGHLVEVPGPHDSIMAGLNCGLASMLALPTVTATFDAFLAIDDDRCRQAIRALADAGLDVGETGAAALAGLLALVDEHRDELPVPNTATVLLLVTEGVTDPANFERVVGRPPRGPV